MSDAADGLADLRAEMQRRFQETPLHALLGIEILEADPDAPGTSTVTMKVGPNSFGSVTDDLHGGAIATLVDVACASAGARATTYRPGENTLVTADMHVRFVGRARTANVRCEAQVVRAGSRQVVVDGRVIDDDGNLVAVCDFSFMLVDLRK
ncbi:MAG: PaaI family thioesterase [Acidimicrobiia bacterium]|nr:PaaI family thioesterase [Acidimicrobiia bacterium]